MEPESLSCYANYRLSAPSSVKINYNKYLCHILQVKWTWLWLVVFIWVVVLWTSEWSTFSKQEAHRLRNTHDPFMCHKFHNIEIFIFIFINIYMITHMVHNFCLCSECVVFIIIYLCHILLLFLEGAIVPSFIPVMYLLCTTYIVQHLVLKCPIGTVHSFTYRMGHLKKSSQ